MTSSCVTREESQIIMMNLGKTPSPHSLYGASRNHGVVAAVLSYVELLAFRKFEGKGPHGAANAHERTLEHCG
jgi:hypothetical protein